MNSALLDFYLCPEHFVNFELAGRLSEEAGYFRCGQNATCFGRSVSGYRRNRPDVPLYDTLADIGLHHGEPVLPFDPTEVIDNSATGTLCEPGWSRPVEWMRAAVERDLLPPATVHGR